ncbi:MAG: hypothetical protein V3S14_00495, partial [Anaerolineae bacterium]
MQLHEIVRGQDVFLIQTCPGRKVHPSARLAVLPDQANPTKGTASLPDVRSLAVPLYPQGEHHGLEATVPSAVRGQRRRLPLMALAPSSVIFVPTMREPGRGVPTTAHCEKP